jgi:hypothetical protein
MMLGLEHVMGRIEDAGTFIGQLADELPEAGALTRIQRR